MDYLELSEELFNDKYAYLVLDSAVEMSLNVVTDENGVAGDLLIKYNN